MGYTKALRKRLRELAAEAYEKELRLELKKLEEQFRLWNEEKIETWTLEEAIHKFHNGPAKKLYVRYVDLPAETVVPYALAKGLLSIDEVPDEIAAEMQAKARFSMNRMLIQASYLPSFFFPLPDNQKLP